MIRRLLLLPFVPLLILARVVDNAISSLADECEDDW